MAGGYVLDQLIGEGAERLIQAGISQGRNAHEAVRFERALRGVTRVAGTIGAARTGGKIGGGKGRSTLECTSKGLLTSAFSKGIKACVRDVEAKSGIPLTKEHRQLLKKDMQQNQYRKLEGEAKQPHKDSYTSTVKERLQKEWSDHYKHPWPTTPRLLP